MRKIAHIVNKIKPKPSSDLNIAQPITFETMRAARDFAKGKVDVDIITTSYLSEGNHTPKGFIKAPPLKRSISNIVKFKKRMRLALIREIIDRTLKASDAEYIIYTNVDIGLQKNFYVKVNEIIDQGYDAFVINRRTISDKWKSTEELSKIYKDPGKKHGGHDCFIFKRSAYKKYKLFQSFIGMEFGPRALLLNLICNSEKFKEFKNSKLTFHIGDERAWKDPKMDDYREYNLLQLKKSWDYFKRRNLTKKLKGKMLERMEVPIKGFEKLEERRRQLRLLRISKELAIKLVRLENRLKLRIDSLIGLIGLGIQKASPFLHKKLKVFAPKVI